MTKATHIIAAIGLALFAGGGFTGGAPAIAQEQGQQGQTGADHEGTGGHGAHGASNTSALPDSPATKAYRAANMAMHGDMDIEFTGDPDIDFVRGMIPHHQGAVEMACILLEYGQDPELRQFAQQIIDTQEAEIAFMENWLADHAE